MILKPCSWDQAPAILRLIREKNWPASISSYNKLNGQYYLNTACGQAATLLTPDGEVDEHATFVLKMPYSELHIHTLDPDLLEGLAEGMVSCPDIDWTQSPIFSHLRDTFYPVLDALERRLSGYKRNDCYVRSFHLDRDAALKLQYKLPEDVSVGELRVEDAPRVNDLWPHGDGLKTLELVKEYIRCRPSVAIFHKEELVAWCLYGEYGGPQTLQVAEQHMKKGYGEIALVAMSRICAEMGISPHAYIVPHNHASMGLFTKLGYVEKFPATWTAFLDLSCDAEQHS